MFETGDGAADPSGSAGPANPADSSGPDAEIPGGEDPGDGSADPSGPSDPDAEIPGGEDPGDGELAPAAGGMQMMGGMMPMGGGGPTPLIPGNMYNPTPIELNQEYIMESISPWRESYFCFEIDNSNIGKYYLIEATPSHEEEGYLELRDYSEGVGDWYSAGISTQKSTYGNSMYYKFSEIGLYGIQIVNGPATALTFMLSIQEVTSPPLVNETDVVTPSTTPGSQGNDPSRGIGQKATIFDRWAKNSCLSSPTEVIRLEPSAQRQLLSIAGRRIVAFPVQPN